MAKKKQQDEEEQQQGKSSKFSGLGMKGLKEKAKALFLPLCIFSNVFAMLYGGYLTYMGTLGMTVESIREEKARSLLFKEEVFKDKPVVYALDPFTVNLADDDQRIVQVKVSLEMLDEDGFEEVVSMGAHARDTIVQILNGKTFNELQSIQGKLFLKDEISVALNNQLKRSFIKDIYFSRFVLQ